MKISEIRRLVKLVETSGISEIEIEEEGSRIKIVKQLSNNGRLPSQTGEVTGQLEPSSSAVQVNPSGAIPVAPEVAPDATLERLLEVTSPMVGTFYRAPSPEAPPYVNIGDRVSVGQVLCIIEAMKLMNEIEAEVSGRIVKILVENVQPVEFGQPIFIIDPD